MIRRPSLFSYQALAHVVAAKPPRASTSKFTGTRGQPCVNCMNQNGGTTEHVGDSVGDPVYCRFHEYKSEYLVY